MVGNVVYLHAQPAEIGQFLRVGTSGHRQLETLLGSGRLPIGRFVLDGSAVLKQQDLLSSLKDAGREIVLDTNAADLSVIGRFDGSAKAAPWANQERMLLPEDFGRKSNQDVIGKIARFAVEHGFTAVQAPTHLLEGSADPWLQVDLDSCHSLRRVLDAEGGRNILIDYPLITTTAVLRDPVQRRAFLQLLGDLPIDYLWIRASGFGSDASPVGIRRYIAAIGDFQRLQRPIVADGVGGLTALAVVAFGAASGVAHGVAERERFDAGDWNKPRSGGGGGRERRILIPGLDRLLSEKQVNLLMATQGARRLLSCHDPRCCAHGHDDTLHDPKAHYLHQRHRQFQELSAVPEARRARHFIDKDLAAADRIARQAARLKVQDEDLSGVLSKSSQRLDKMVSVLDDLAKTIGEDAGRCAATRDRTSRQRSLALGRQ